MGACGPRCATSPAGCHAAPPELGRRQTGKVRPWAPPEQGGGRPAAAAAHTRTRAPRAPQSPQSLTQARALLGAGPTEAGRAKLCQRWSAGVQRCEKGDQRVRSRLLLEFQSGGDGPCLMSAGEGRTSRAGCGMRSEACDWHIVESRPRKLSPKIDRTSQFSLNSQVFTSFVL